jgi:hypothetical protein
MVKEILLIYLATLYLLPVVLLIGQLSNLNMDVKKFVNSVYLGDRGCKLITLDGSNDRVLLQVDVISRTRSLSGNWEFYSDEDIENGFIVFTGVSTFSLTPSGYIPNDLIYWFDVEAAPNQEGNEPRFLFKIKIGAASKFGANTEILVQIIAEAIHLEDSRQSKIVS